MSAFYPDSLWGVAAAARDEHDRRMQQLLAQRAGVAPELIRGYGLESMNEDGKALVRLYLKTVTFVATYAELNAMRADAYREEQ